MPLGLWNVQWLNQNANRAYPLAEWGSRTDVTGTIKVPDSLILALYFPVHAGLDVEPGNFYLQSLNIFPTGYNIAIGYDDGTADPPLVAALSIAKSTHVENTTYALPGADDFADSVGRIAIGALDEIDRLAPGSYTFLPAAAPLEVDAIRPMIRGISSITLVNGLDHSEPIYGDVEFVGGTNMRIVANTVIGSNPQIVFSAISGEGLNEACVCDEEGTGPCMKYINGIPPLPNGNFRMIGDTCIQLLPILNGLQLKDACSQPCCGCEELDALTKQIDRFADGVLTLNNFANTVGGVVTQTSQVILGSRLGDNGCLEC